MRITRVGSPHVCLPRRKKNPRGASSYSAEADAKHSAVDCARTWIYCWRSMRARITFTHQPEDPGWKRDRGD